MTKNFFFLNFEILQVSNAKTNGIFFKKKFFVSNDSELSNSARNGKKKFWRQMAVFGGSGGTDAVFFSKLVKIYVKRRLFFFLTYVLRLKPSLKITDCVKVAIPPP